MELVATITYRGYPREKIIHLELLTIDKGELKCTHITEVAFANGTKIFGPF